MTRFDESWIDRQIREAQERGLFDDLPGAGKPLRKVDLPYDQNWWLRELLEREDLSYPLPTSLALRKELDGLAKRLAAIRRESVVREIIGDLNTRIRAAQRITVDGPPVVLETIDVEEAVAAWRKAREGKKRGAEDAEPH